MATNSTMIHNIFKATNFKCYSCGHDRFVHEGSYGHDGMSYWWNGFCEKCGDHYEVDKSTHTINTREIFKPGKNIISINALK